MCKKTRAVLIALFLSLAFATSAFAAGLLGGIIGGLLGVKQVGISNEQFITSAVKTLTEKGDTNEVLVQMEDEYRKYGYEVTRNNGENESVREWHIYHSQLNFHGTVEINRQAHTVSLKYKNPGGGDYELKDGYTPAVSFAQEKSPQAQENVNVSEAMPAISKPFSPDLKRIAYKKIEIPQKSITLPTQSEKPVAFLENDKTGFAEFDNSMLKGNAQLAYFAYRIARVGKDYQYKNMMDKITWIAKEKKNPFAAPALQQTYDKLIEYYKTGKTLDLNVYKVKDFFCPTENPNNIFSVYTEENPRQHFRLSYYTATQKYYLGLADVSFGFTVGDSVGLGGYAFSLPVEKAKAVYNRLVEITEQNKKAREKISAMPLMSKGKVKITAVRIMYALSYSPYGVGTAANFTPVFTNALYTIKEADGYALHGYKQDYDFSNSQWKDIINLEQSNIYEK